MPKSNLEPIFLMPAISYNKKEIQLFKDNRVKEVYSSFGNQLFPSVRRTKELKRISLKKSKRYIKELKKNGITFSLIFNVADYNLREQEIRVINKKIKIIQSLDVDSIVLSDLKLIKYFRKLMPELNIKVSAVSRIKKVKDTKPFRDLGVKDFTLDPSSNYNYKEIKKFIASGLNPTLIVNECCIKNCIYRDQHYRYLSKENNFDPFLIRCNAIKLLNKKEFYNSDWIKPEDIEKYIKIGVKSFKIAGRNFNSDWKIKAIKAYNEKRYNNIFDHLTGGRINKIKISKRYPYLIQTNLTYFLLKVIKSFYKKEEIEILESLNKKEFKRIIQFIYFKDRFKEDKYFRSALSKIKNKAEKKIIEIGKKS